ncbi:hypothetical protein [Kitasatospora sp. NPDC093806]|uniref:hypothetical protein n=1 Tax=Kitasatospora sp. NPDC093806 TaxID=3155075 RepID=UPI00343B0256
MDPDIRLALGKAMVPVMAVLVLLGLGGWGVAVAAEGLAYGAGLSGTRGALVAERCQRVDRSEAVPRVTGDCRGTFFPDGGGPADERARTPDDEAVDLHRRVPVACAADGVCRPTGAFPVLHWVSVLLLALTAFPVAGFVAVQGLLVTRDWSQRWRIGLGVAAAVLLLGAFATFAGAMAAK